jgi:surface antigen
MFKSIAAASLLAASTLLLATPARADCDDNEAAATVGGAIIGGIIGNQFGSGSGKAAATVGGVILGGLAGREIAKDSCDDDRYDAYYYDDAYADAFEDGANRRYVWNNPRTRHHGWVRPTRYYENGWNDYDGPCRGFESRIYVEDDEEYAYGVACRTASGRWKVVSMKETG